MFSCLYLRVNGKMGSGILISSNSPRQRCLEKLLLIFPSLSVAITYTLSKYGPDWIVHWPNREHDWLKFLGEFGTWDHRFTGMFGAAVLSGLLLSVVLSVALGNARVRDCFHVGDQLMRYSLRLNFATTLLPLLYCLCVPQFD